GKPPHFLGSPIDQRRRKGRGACCLSRRTLHKRKTMTSQRHTPTAERRKMVEEAAGHGMPHATIAKILDVHVQTLGRHYAAELATGADLAYASDRRRLVS